MMMEMDNYDASGPLISCGNVAFSVATNLPGGRHAFEVPTFMLASEESRVDVSYDGVDLCDFGTFSDYYGFGSSPEEALRSTGERIKRMAGSNLDIAIVSTIELRPCLESKRPPFYNGAQRVCYIPPAWSHNRDDIKKTEEVFTVWRNGFPTDEAGTFFARIADLVGRDAAPSRNGDLRSIITRKKPATPETFLLPDPPK
jgi:hypothetical protein